MDDFLLPDSESEGFEQPEQPALDREVVSADGHLALAKAELVRIGQRLEDDYRGAKAEHDPRIAKFKRYIRKWRNLAETPRAGEEVQFDVPLTQWQIYGKWAEEIYGLFGDDAEIIADPTGPSDQRIDHKIGRYMSWRIFKSLKLLNPFCVFSFHKIAFGRSFAYRPYKIEKFNGFDLKTKQPKEQIWRDGPCFLPIHPDDLIVPAEDAQTIHDFSFVIRRYRVSPQQLLNGEREGLYFGIRENFADILREYEQQRGRASDGDELRVDTDEAQGTNPDGSQQSRNGIEVWEWYGKRRLPVGTDGDPEDNSIEGRNLDESELVVRYLPAAGLQRVIGVQDLAEQYPHMKDRRPFSESALVKDGSYWGPSFPELLERIQQEATINHNLFTDAGRFTVGPLIFYKPGAGANPKTMKYAPNMMVPTDDPNAVKVVSLSLGSSLQYPIAKDQWLTQIAERITGRSDLNSGRTIERPNAPKTATGTVALLEQGNIRASLDMITMREDYKQIFQDLWMLDAYFGPPELFFRVTEEDAKGLFETANGGAYLTADERHGNYDFTLKLATSAWNKETRKMQKMQLYQIDLTNPLIATSPRALWKITADVHKAFGDDNFSDIVPEPPDLDLPKNPKEEWSLMLRGEDVEPHPMDNDQLHLVDHLKRLAETRGQENRDEDAVNRMIGHVMKHKDQIEQKQLMQVAADQFAGALQGMMGGGGEPGEAPEMGAPEQAGGGMLEGNPIQEQVTGAMGLEG